MYRCWICQHTGLNEMHEQHKGKCTWRDRLRRSLIHRPCTARTPHKNQRTSGRPSLRKRARGERQDNKTSTSQEHALSHTVSFWQLLTQRRRRCSVRRMISHRLFPAQVIRWSDTTYKSRATLGKEEGKRAGGTFGTFRVCFTPQPLLLNGLTLAFFPRGLRILYHHER